MINRFGIRIYRTIKLSVSKTLEFARKKPTTATNYIARSSKKINKGYEIYNNDTIITMKYVDNDTVMLTAEKPTYLRTQDFVTYATRLLKEYEKTEKEKEVIKEKSVKKDDKKLEIETKEKVKNYEDLYKKTKKELIEIAKELGIETEDKTKKQILAEIKEKLDS